MKLDEAIMKRASVRYFSEEPVSDEEIRALIEAAIRAPTASGLENWLFVVFKSEEARKKIYDLIGQGMVEYYRAVNLPEEKIEKLRNTIDTTDNLLKIANFRRIFERIKEAKTQDELWMALRELETAPVPMEDDRVDAMIFAHRKIIQMQLNSLVDMMNKAAEMFNKDDIYSAKKTFQKVKESLLPLLETAKKYSLVEEITKINSLIDACDNNISGINHLLETAERPPGWKLKIPNKESFLVEEAEEVEEFFDSSVEYETRLEQIKERYKLTRLIGEGAFSYVYEAKNPSGRKIALKVLKYLDKESTSTFMREFAAAQKLNHETIVKVYRADPRLGFLEMELANGSLEDLMSHGSIPVTEAGKIIFEMTRALSHAQGILHRDIKPSNILIFGRDQYKLGDWGLAKLTTGATRKSSLVRHKTILYASPEQVTNPEKMDERSDIFQLGIVFYEMLTGKHPFAAEYEAAIIKNIIEKEVEPPSYYNPNASVFDEIVMKMLEKDPEKRYRTARELQYELREALLKLGAKVRQSVGPMERRRLLAENVLMHLKLVVDSYTSPDVDYYSEMSETLKHMEYLYRETGDAELRNLYEQMKHMFEENVKPGQDTLKEAFRVLRRWA